MSNFPLAVINMILRKARLTSCLLINVKPQEFARLNNKLSWNPGNSQLKMNTVLRTLHLSVGKDASESNGMWNFKRRGDLM